MLGDIGKVDAHGCLTLVDRRAFMINSGGVNNCPQEAEAVPIGHPVVADGAVVGVPSEDFGEDMKAVVQLIDPARAGPEMASEPMAYCRGTWPATSARSPSISIPSRLGIQRASFASSWGDCAIGRAGSHLSWFCMFPIAPQTNVPTRPYSMERRCLLQARVGN